MGCRVVIIYNMYIISTRLAASEWIFFVRNIRTNLHTKIFLLKSGKFEKRRTDFFTTFDKHYFALKRLSRNNFVCEFVYIFRTEENPSGSCQSCSKYNDNTAAHRANCVQNCQL